MFGSLGSLMAAIPGYFEAKAKQDKIASDIAFQEAQKKDMLQRLLMAQKMQPYDIQGKQAQINEAAARTKGLDLGNQLTAATQQGEIEAKNIGNKYQSALAQGNMAALPDVLALDKQKRMVEALTAKNDITKGTELSKIYALPEYAAGLKNDTFAILSKQMIENKAKQDEAAAALMHGKASQSQAGAAWKNADTQAKELAYKMQALAAEHPFGAELSRLTEQLKTATPPERPNLIMQIKELQAAVKPKPQREFPIAQSESPHIYEADEKTGEQRKKIIPPDDPRYPEASLLTQLETLGKNLQNAQMVGDQDSASTILNQMKPLYEQYDKVTKSKGQNGFGAWLARLIQGNVGASGGSSAPLGRIIPTSKFGGSLR